MATINEMTGVEIRAAILRGAEEVARRFARGTEVAETVRAQLETHAPACEVRVQGPPSKGDR